MLMTHLREEDGLDRADAVVSCVSIDETGTTPFVLIAPPLRRAVSPFPGYQEFAHARTSDRTAQLTFLRPSFLSPGQMMSSAQNGVQLLRMGTEFGLEVQVAAPTLAEAEDASGVVMGSLAYAS
jgi:hypothetical protein